MQSISINFPTIKQTVSELKQLNDYEKQNDDLISYDIEEHLPNRINLENDLSQYPLIYQRGLGLFIGSAVGDSLGNLTDLFPIDYERNIIQNFDSLDNEGLRVPKGLYSDDTSMAICLADSLILNNKFNAQDIRHRFCLWWFYGYNNGKSTYFRQQNKLEDNILQDMIKELKPSVKASWSSESFGIGNSTWLSILHFIKFPFSESVCDPKLEFTQSGKNGNGSIMRLSPIPIFYSNNLEQAVSIAKLSSYLTHEGEEASEACGLLAYILVKIINRNNDQQDIKVFFDSLNFEELQIQNKSVLALSRSEQEQEYIADKYNQCSEDRFWNWKSKQYKYSPTRTSLSPSGIGGYVMDCLCMALNISYNSSSYQNAILKAVNLGGDADTLAVVVGQICGAFYGINKQIQSFYDLVNKWDQNKIVKRVILLLQSQNNNCES